MKIYGRELLIPLEEAHADEIFLTWPGRPGDRLRPGEIGHVYQFGLRGSSVWDDAFPACEPICGAPPYRRAHHNRWVSDSAVVCVGCAIRLAELKRG